MKETDLETAVSTTLVAAKELVVEGHGAFESAAEFVRGVKELKAVVESTFKPIKQKIDEAKKEVLDKEKEHLAPLDEAERIVKLEMAKWDEQCALLELEDRKKIEAEKETLAEEYGVEVENLPTRAPSVNRPKAKGVSVKRLPRFKVVDISQVGESFLSVDEKKIGQIVRSMGKDAEKMVGGIEVYYDTSIAVKK